MIVAKKRSKQIHPIAAYPKFVTVPPPLEAGDHLTRLEFEKRYKAMPRLKKAELIEGVVFMSSPTRVSHSRAHTQVIIWLGAYHVATPGSDLNDNATVRLDTDNEVQPDVLLRLDDAVGGMSKVSADDYVEGTPELVVEISGSSASYDLHDKLKVYRRNGVPEYVVWRVYEQKLDWFRLSQGQYTKLKPDANSIIKSQVLPGLQLAVTALLAGDLSEVLAITKQGLETEAHLNFVNYLTKLD